MKKVLFFAATAICFASCGTNQETADKAKIDSMSMELAKQRVIDSMSNAAAIVGASPIEATPAMQSRGSNSQTHSHSSGHVTHSNNASPANAAQGTAAAAPQGVNNAPTQPTAEELAAKKKADNKKLLNSTAAGAMIGAGAGAIGGVIAGKNDHFKKEDALIGGGVGAAVGAGAGYLLQKRKQKRDTTNR